MAAALVCLRLLPVVFAGCGCVALFVVCECFVFLARVALFYFFLFVCIPVSVSFFSLCLVSPFFTPFLSFLLYINLVVFSIFSILYFYLRVPVCLPS